MLSKAQNKYIRALSQQKYRKEYGVFVVEGDKIAREWLGSNQRVEMIVAVEAWYSVNEMLIRRHPDVSIHVVNEAELASISTLQTPNQVLLVVRRPEQTAATIDTGWCIALDNLQDPGNMGTIIRIADWFGIPHIVCSPGCADMYNPKVIQAAMGGHLRVNIMTLQLDSFFSSSKLPVIAATLGGQSIYEMPGMAEGIIVIGNESKGISQEIIKDADYRVTIPRKGGAESLNAGVSAGILCALLIK